MIELGIILLILGAIAAVACHFGGVPVGVRIGLATAIVGLVLIVLGYVLPSLAVHDDYDTAAPLAAVAQHR